MGAAWLPKQVFAQLPDRRPLKKTTAVISTPK